jgi:hypothetical protein
MWLWPVVDLVVDIQADLVVAVLVDIDPVSPVKCLVVVPAQNLRQRWRPELLM